MIPYKHSNIPRAKALRKAMTHWERKLWYEFLRDYPVRFKRQFALDNYIVDFYCDKAKMVIEIDGSQHYEKEAMEYDQKRTEYLESLNICVIRFTNTDISRQFRYVCDAVDKEIRQRIINI